MRSFCEHGPEKTHITERPVDYHEFYDEETKAKLAECFAREIKLLNYQFH